jgi:gliding motility-associated-like protein
MPPITLTNLTANQTVGLGSNVQLYAAGASYFWWSPDNGSLSNPNINNPIATPTDSVTTYRVIGMSQWGCVDTAYVTIRVGEEEDDDMPGGFTPNHDGLNDVFRIVNLKHKKLDDFRIFNRWGREVFHTSDPSNGWDGTLNGEPQDIGVYYYQIILSHPDGQQKTYTGNVTLIR